MAQNAIKSYFLSPSFDWPAEGGPVQLGAIITDRKKPQQSINSPNFELPSEYKSEKLDWEVGIWRRKNWFATVFGQFLQGVGLDLKVGADGDWSRAEVIKCEKLETRELVLTKSYVKARMQDEAVQEYLKKNRIKAYMITGIKVAYNPVAYMLKTKGMHANAGAALGTSSPMQGVGAGSDAGSQTTQAGGTNIVFAYRLMGLMYEIKDGRNATIETWDEDGKFMNTNRENFAPRINGPDTDVVEICDITEVETSGKGLEPRGGFVDEVDEQACVCIVVKEDPGRGFLRNLRQRDD